VFAVMMSLIGAFYYLRVVKVMYFDAPVTATTVSAPRDVRTVLTLNGALILILGIVPGGLMTLCAQGDRGHAGHLIARRVAKRLGLDGAVVALLAANLPFLNERLLALVPLRPDQVAGHPAGRTGAALFRRRRHRPAVRSAGRADRAAGLGVLRGHRRAVHRAGISRIHLALPS
jgi:hypothetical protein